jgi:hypothetical protein
LTVTGITDAILRSDQMIPQRRRLLRSELAQPMISS